MGRLSPEYCAGFFDGEGNIAIKYRVFKRGRRAFELRLMIAQKDLAPLGLLQEQFGGKIRTCKRGVSYLTFTGASARVFLRTVFDFLIVKREEAQVAMEFADLLDGDPNCYIKSCKGGRYKLSPENLARRIELFERISEVRRENGFTVKRRPCLN